MMGASSHVAFNNDITCVLVRNRAVEAPRIQKCIPQTALRWNNERALGSVELVSFISVHARAWCQQTIAPWFESRVMLCSQIVVGQIQTAPLYTDNSFVAFQIDMKIKLAELDAITAKKEFFMSRKGKDLFEDAETSDPDVLRPPKKVSRYSRGRF